MENLNNVLVHIALTQSPQYLNRIEAEKRLIKANEELVKLLKEINQTLKQYNKQNEIIK